MTADAPAWPVRPATESDQAAFLDLDHMAFGGVANPREPAQWQALLSAGAALVAHEPGKPDQLVGISAHTPVQVSLPHGAGATPHNTHGLTWVGVRPDRRRRGILRALMAAQLAWARDHSYAWSGLTASEPGIYGRFGYGQAVPFHAITADSASFGSDDTTSNDDASYHFDLMPLGEEAFALHKEVWGKYAQQQTGVVTLSDNEIRAEHTTDSHHNLHHPQPRMAVLRHNGQPVAACVVTRLPATSADASKWGQVIWQMVSATDAARCSLAQKVCSFDLVGKTRIRFISGEDALLWAGDGPTNLDVATSDGLWLRPVHCDAALRTLFWRDPINVVIKLSDPVPGTAAKVRVQADTPGIAVVEPTDQEPCLTLSSELLGALSCGAYRPHGALRHGSYTEHRPGVATEVATALRGVMAPGVVAMF